MAGSSGQHMGFDFSQALIWLRASKRVYRDAWVLAEGSSAYVWLVLRAECYNIDQEILMKLGEPHWQVTAQAGPFIARKYPDSRTVLWMPGMEDLLARDYQLYPEQPGLFAILSNAEKTK